MGSYQTAQDFVDIIAPSFLDIYGVYMKNKSSYLQPLMANANGRTYSDITHKWSDLQLAPKEWARTGSTVTAATINGGGATFTIGGGSAGLKVDDIVGVKTSAGIRRNYQLKVTTVGATTFVASVYGGTTAANDMVAGDVVFFISHPMPENNKSFDTNKSKLPTIAQNYSQIFETSFEISDTALNGVNTFTDVNTLAFIMQQGMVEIERQMAMQAWIGRGVARDTANGVYGSFKGLDQMIDGNVTTTSSALTSAMIADLVQSVVTAGGVGDTIACSIKTARKISSFNVAGNNPIVTQSSHSTGSYVTTFVSDIPMGNGLFYNILIDQSLSDSELYILTLGNIALLPMQDRALHPVNATQNGQDGYTFLLRGEYTLEVQGAQFAHAKLTGFTL